MARKKTETRVSDPPPVVSPVLAAADQMNEGTGAPRQDYEFVIHLADRHTAVAYCGEKIERVGIEVVAPLNHPAICSKCRSFARKFKRVAQPMLVRNATTSP